MNLRSWRTSAQSETSTSGPLINLFVFRSKMLCFPCSSLESIMSLLQRLACEDIRIAHPYSAMDGVASQFVCRGTQQNRRYHSAFNIPLAKISISGDQSLRLQLNTQPGGARRSRVLAMGTCHVATASRKTPLQRVRQFCYAQTITAPRQTFVISYCYRI